MTLQRFISEDPIGFAAGDLNIYSYVSNSPVNYTDPSGEGPITMMRKWIKIGLEKVLGKAAESAIDRVATAVIGQTMLDHILDPPEVGYNQATEDFYRRTWGHNTPPFDPFDPSSCLSCIQIDPNAVAGPSFVSTPPEKRKTKSSELEIKLPLAK